MIQRERGDTGRVPLSHKPKLMRAPAFVQSARSESEHTEAGSFKETFNFLTKGQSLFKIDKEGKVSVRSVRFTSDLMKLIVEKPRSTLSVLSSEIQSIEAESLKDTVSGYGFKIQTIHKQIQLVTRSKCDRESWLSAVSALIKVYQDWKNDSLKTFWMKKQNYRGRSLLKRTHPCQERVKQVETANENLAKQHQASQDQLQSLKSHYASLDDKMRSLATENKNLKRKLADTQKKLLYLQKDIHKHKASNREMNIQLRTFVETLNYKELKELPKMWIKILEYFTFAELHTLQYVSKFYREIVTQYISEQNNWSTMVASSLTPRDISWMTYITSFHSLPPASIREEIAPDLLIDIRKDVNRGIFEYKEEVEEVLIRLCAINPHIGYCQGMQVIGLFLMKQLRNRESALQMFLTLLHPPYYLEGVWKEGFSRLKLAVFQLEFLVKMKLPILAKHLKSIDLKLEVIVSPWILTLFVHLNYQQSLPLDVIGEIWDTFLVKGWPALISACLVFLDLGQPGVINQSLDHTLEFFTRHLPSAGVKELLKKYEINAQVLSDLEKAYYLK